jgi:formamidopyrimidine-DNA glycosylase
MPLSSPKSRYIGPPSRMPELPEVETIVRMLAPHAEGRRIAMAELRLPRMLIGMPGAEFPAALGGRRIERVLRRGKYIVIELEGCALVIHLGMTGQLTWSPSGYRVTEGFTRTLTGLQRPNGVHPVDKHTHLILHLDGGERVLFRDPRTFGNSSWYRAGSGRAIPACASWVPNRWISRSRDSYGQPFRGKAPVP